MKNFWHQIPLALVFFAGALGVGLYILTGEVMQVAGSLLFPAWIATGVLFVLLLLYGYTKPVFKFKAGWLAGSATLLLTTVVYFLLTYYYTTKHRPDFFANHNTKNNVFKGVLVKPPIVKAKMVMSQVELSHLYKGDTFMVVTGYVLVNWLRNSASEKLQYGDEIVFTGNPEWIAPPKNPGEFDFKLYKSFHRVHHRIFLTEGKWKLTAHKKGKFILYHTYRLRAHFLAVIQRSIQQPNDFAVASAMLLGYRDFMGQEIVQAYSGTGALHVLCVSGLHVGIMFLVLNYLLSWMEKKGERYRIAKTVIIVLFIWFYACLTGLSPSVMRAATMFSMIQLGKTLSRQTNIYNILAGSAVLLMMFNPFIITEIGFRLSYLAVLGIVFLQPRIYALLTVKNKLLDMAWAITAVSIAAQIATFPIGIYYFHQFPNLFFVSNLIVIPASNFILFSGIAMFATDLIPYVNIATGWLTEQFVHWLNEIILLFNYLPYALTDRISITMTEMWLMYAIIVAACIYIATYKKKWIIICLGGLLLLSTFNALSMVKQYKQQLLTVYSVKNQTAIAYTSNDTAFYWIDDKLYQNNSAMLFHILHHWWAQGIQHQLPAQHVKTHPLPYGLLYYLNGKSILLINRDMESRMPVNNTETKTEIDYVIISGNPYIRADYLLSCVNIGQLIIDSSNKPSKARFYQNVFKKANIKVWNVAVQGAYTTTL